MGLFTRSNPSAIPPLPKPITADEMAAIAPPPPASVALQSSRSAMLQSAPPSERQQYFQQLKVRIHQQLVERLDVQNLRTLPPEVVRSEARVLIRELCQNERSLINSADQERLMDEVMDETFGLGPLETLLKDP